MLARPRIFALIFGLIFIPMSLFAQTTTAPKPKQQAPKPKRIPITRTFDTQLSGFTSQDADQLYARLSMQENRDSRSWYIRGSISRTATKNGNTENHVSTTKLDSRYEHATSKEGYNVWTGVLSRRDRDPGGKKKSKQSGYESISYGIGRQMGPKAKGDIGLGLLDVYNDEDGTAPAVMCSIRGRHPLSKKLTLESDILALQPTDRLRNTKVDSDLGLAYELAPGFYLRLGWAANNLIEPVRNTSREWDSVIRLSISLRRTTTR